MFSLTEREKVAHLLRRFGLGASEAEVDFYSKNGLKGAIDALLDIDGDDGANISLELFQNDKGVVNIRGVQYRWILQMLTNRKPLKDKLALFWHDHFAISAQKVESPSAMDQYVETLRAKGYGRFEDLLLAMSKDPAMIYWLDNQLNVKGKPNENFGREIMELFTLGEGNYTEKDVQEVARAFTGWGYGRAGRQITSLPRRGADFVFNPRNHDDGMKTILGNKGPFNGDDVVGILCGNPQTSKYIAKKMWEFFAYSKPDQALVDRLAKTWRDSGLKILVLVRAIMESPEFWSEKAYRKQVKNPVDFCLVTMRELGLGTQIRERLVGAKNVQTAGLAGASVISGTSMKSMGMELLFPPDVAGWEWGAAWISSATMVERIKWAEELFGPAATGTRGQSMRLPAAGFLMPGQTPQEYARSLQSLFDCQLPPDKVKQLEAAAVKAAEGNLVRNVNAVTRSVCQLIFASPEFQFC